MSDEIPRFLARYYSLAHPEWIREVILDSRIYFPSPRTFNDPFDSRVNVRYHGTEQQQRKFLEAHLKRANPALTRAERRRLASTQRERFFSEDTVASQNQWMQSQIDQLGVACFSADSSHILMWSHYAAGHTGVCLTFHHSEDEALFGRALPVHYQDEYPLLNYLTSETEEEWRSVLLTKSAHWAYEREWRIIEHQGPGHYTFPPPSLHEVILGCRISEEHAALVSGWVEAASPGPKLSQANVASERYAIDLT